MAEAAPDPDAARAVAMLALQQLVAAWCRELDETAGLQATQFFTADCTMDLGSMVLRGHGEMQAFYEKFAADVAALGEGTVRTTRHAFTNLQIDFAGHDAAELAFLVMNYSGVGAAPLFGATAPSVVSDVRLRCRREGDGRWRIHAMRGGPVFVGEDPVQNKALVG